LVNIETGFKEIGQGISRPAEEVSASQEFHSMDLADLQYVITARKMCFVSQ
jgi:hypothetical protein